MFTRPQRRIAAALGGTALVVSQFAILTLTPHAQADPVSPTPDCSGATCSVTYGYTGSAQTFTVPAEVTSLSVTVMGAAGGTTAMEGGRGGRTAATLSVAPGDELTVVAGQLGLSGRTGDTYGGGGPTRPGSQGSSGGGGSFVFGPELLLAAGGGGGNTGLPHARGGDGGGAAGGTGAGYPDSIYDYTGATGGTQSAGGTGGQFYLFQSVYASAGTSGTGPASSPTSLGQGGAGGFSSGEEYGAGGGGGGGYYGGGAGGHYQSGGGGSGYAAPSVTDVVSADGVNSGAGSVTFSWARTQVAQELLVTSAPPSDAVVGDEHVLTVTGGGSTSPIGITAVDDSVCSVGQVTGTVVGGAQHASAPISFDKRGSCRLTLTQAGDAPFEAAIPAEVSIAVAAAPTETYVDLPATSAVYGQPLTATVGTSPAVPGTLHLTRADGSGQVSLAERHVEAGDGSTDVALDLLVGTHQLSARFVPDDLDRHAESTTPIPSTLHVTPAASTTALRVTGDRLTATVTADAPSVAVPTGTITFTLGTTSLGAPVPLVDGVASLDYSVPTGGTRQVRATYSGQATDGETQISGSLATTSRQDPRITAAVSSAAPRSRSGWHSRPVTVRFTCVAGSGDLTGSCPAPVTVSRDGIHTITRTVLAEDGGAATRTVVVKVDRTRPSVAIRGVRAGHVYAQLPRARCTAADATSGVATCKIRRTVRGGKVVYRATAVDNAGNTRSTRVSVRRPRVLIAGADYSGPRPVVRHGSTYTLVVTSKVRPRYVYAAPAPGAPRGDGGAFTRAGKNRWVKAVTFYRSRAHALWNFGVAIGNRTTVVTVRVE